MLHGDFSHCTDMTSKPPSQPRVQRQQRGEERRAAILRATWQVVLRDGVRGVRHRAVAEAAAVPLAATTYYFSDIKDLLIQSFQLFAEESLSQFTQPFWRQAEERMASLGELTRGEAEVVLTDLGAEFIRQRLSNHREHLVIEYAFWYAALHSEELQASVRDMASRWIALFLPWLQRFQLTVPEQAARTLLSAVRRIEYEGLIQGSATRRPDWIRESLSYQIKGLW